MMCYVYVCVFCVLWAMLPESNKMNENEIGRPGKPHPSNQKLRHYLAYNPELWQFDFFYNFPIGAIVKFRFLKLSNLVKF